MTGYANIHSYAFRKKIHTWYTRVTGRFPRKKVVTTIKKRPFVSFFASLLLLFLIIVLASILAPKPETTEPDTQVKEVAVYKTGSGPTIQTKAQIEKTGVIKIYAQTAGIVQNVNVVEGQEISRGTTLMSLSTNYTGGNAPGIQAQIANEQYKHATQTFDTQKDLISKQREIANKSDENSDKLRDISEQSLGETRDLLRFNEDTLTLLNNQPETPELRQSKAGLQASINQLKAQVRSLEYQTNEDNVPDDLENLQKDIALSQLDVQEKSLEMGKQVAYLSYQLAGVQASLMNPASPSNGIIQRVHVVFGQSVTPGTLLVTMFQPDHEIVAVAHINANLAQQVSQGEMSTLTFENGKTVKLAPRFVSTEATDGKLYSILYTVPNEYTTYLTDREFVSIDVPLFVPSAASVTQMIPVDGVYKTEQGAYVFIVEKGRVVSKQIEIGEIFGSYIEVISGLSEGDIVILDRNVIDGEKVTPQKT